MKVTSPLQQVLETSADQLERQVALLMAVLALALDLAFCLWKCVAPGLMPLVSLSPPSLLSIRPIYSLYHHKVVVQSTRGQEVDL